MQTISVNQRNYTGTPIDACMPEDFSQCCTVFFCGQNTGRNNLRFLHTLKSAVERGCRIITFDRARDRGLIVFVGPQDVAQMMLGITTQMSV
jgi:anaerobic selenocysteine-containing dehydrogenase